MKAHRRRVLKSFLAISAIAALPRLLFAARPDTAFESTNADQSIADLFGMEAVDSDQVTMKIPDIAENGAVVPVTVSTDLAEVESISIVVVNNPTPLAVSFNLVAGLPYLRVSPVHGTAFDIAGKGLADEENLLEALLQAARWTTSADR